MNIMGHLHVITAHKRLVRKYCFRLGLYRQGLLHDLSKYSPAEFIPGIRYYHGGQSPNIGERQDKGYSAAWMHHKGRNKHHMEYWTDYSSDSDRGLVPMEMPLQYVAEMFCDRIAASKIYNKENYRDSAPLEYFATSRERYVINENTQKILFKLLTILKIYGEDEAFRYLKHLLNSVGK